MTKEAKKVVETLVREAEAEIKELSSTTTLGEAADTVCKWLCVYITKAMEEAKKNGDPVVIFAALELSKSLHEVTKGIYTYKDIVENSEILEELKKHLAEEKEDNK